MNNTIVLINAIIKSPIDLLFSLVFLILFLVVLAYGIREILMFCLGIRSMVTNQEQIIKLLKEQNEILNRKSE